MNIIPNPLVIGLQLIPFLLTAIALYQIIFKPMLDYLAEREGATEGTNARAAALLEKIEAMTQDYENRLAQAQSQIRELRAGRRAKTMAAYNARIDAARKGSERHVAEALEELEAERQAARQQLRDSSESLADQITGQILQSLAG